MRIFFLEKKEKRKNEINAKNMRRGVYLEGVYPKVKVGI